MLKSWSIENFKPIVNSGELKLAPVTVLAGRNSSGKSSLLQSILMIKQTLSNQLPERALLPNEAIVQLGTYEDILNEASQSKKLTVTFEMIFEREKIRSSSESIFLRTISNTKKARVTIVFCSPSGNGKSSSAIEASRVSVDSVSLQIDAEINSMQLSLFQEAELEAKEAKFILNIKAISTKELEEFLYNVSSDYLRLVPYTNEQSNYLGTFDIIDGADTLKGLQSCLVALSHFLPTRLIQKFKVEERRKQSLERALHYLFEYPGSIRPHQFTDLFDFDTPISQELKTSIYEICKESNIPTDFEGFSLHNLANWFKSTRKIARGSNKKAIGIKIQEKIMQHLMQKSEFLNKENSEGLESVINNIYAESLDQAIVKVTRFFTSQIRYLGPLRADPQASQKYAPSSELDNVGAKGEYAAAVYDANQNARIEWYNPVSQQIEQGTLKEALDHWARYLDVANQIKIEPAGQSGFSWQVVHKKGQRPLPLSAVGVGISQVLPILVMGLLSPNNTLLIVEQPELHLHPGVQARLGDFFVGLSKCKKQCIIETHSENLVSQLRYHIVQAGGMENSDCMIYFVDQDEKGAAKFEQVEISPNGNILNWPDGFFDETMLQEDRITAASLRKRARKVKNG